MGKASFRTADCFDPEKEIQDSIAKYVQSEIDLADVESVSSVAAAKGGILITMNGNKHLSVGTSIGQMPQIPVVPLASAPVTAADLMRHAMSPKAKIAPERELYKGLLTQGDLTIWLGREKHRKSNFVLQFGISAAIGRDFLGSKYVGGDPVKVALLDFESKPASLKQRRDAIVKAMGLSSQERALLDRNLVVVPMREIRKSGGIVPKFPFKTTDKEGSMAFWEDVVTTFQADVYIIDPLRTLHAADENDSSIESLLKEIGRIFKGATVILPHHMRKPNEMQRTLVDDMRAWSDGARGSSAIKAGADVIVLQERSINDRGEEIVHLGAFLKDGADIDPFPLMESDNQSFYWEPKTIVPNYLRDSYEALTPGKTYVRADAAKEIMATGISKATAYRHIDALIRSKLLSDIAGKLKVSPPQP